MVINSYKKPIFFLLVFFLFSAFSLSVHAEQKPLYIISLKGPPVSKQLTVSAKNSSRPDLKSRSVQSSRLKLGKKQKAACRLFEKTIHRPIKIIKNFDISLNAVAVRLFPEEVEQILMLPEVLSVKKEKMYSLFTDAGPAWIGADKVWNSYLSPSKGEGIVIGIIDTGINPANPSFSEKGDDGYVHTNPKDRFFGVCDSANADYDPDFSCNDKLIGAYDFTDLGDNPYNTETAYDVHGHGSHVAGTAAGNFVNNAEYREYTLSVSGVAPHANIISYRACYQESAAHPEWNGCPEVSVLAAIEQAILDGVDIINFSIGGNPEDPWGEKALDAQAFLLARDLGIFVAAAAGNDGPDPKTINSPANAPWVLSVGSVSHNRIFNNGIKIDDEYGDIIYPSSSRGPGLYAPDILKPELMAPGVNILAAYGTENTVSWNVATGTSMASPHAAGAAALIKAVHPDWTPAEIQSALLATAVVPRLKAGPGDNFIVPGPFDSGAGRIDVSAAAKAGFVLDESSVNYINADPKKGADASSLNLASLTRSSAVVNQTWTRTLRSTMNESVDWIVSVENPEGITLSVRPASFTLAPGAYQTIALSADVTAADYETWLFGRIFFTSSSMSAAAASFPVSVKRSSSSLVDSIIFNEVKEQDNASLYNLEPGNNINSLNIKSSGLYASETIIRSLYQDPTPEDFSDTLPPGKPEEGTFIVTKKIKAGTKRLVAEISDTSSLDLDLYIVNQAGTELFCTSAEATAHEYCSIENPAPGNYRIIVQNWQASSADSADTVSLSVAEIMDADAENLFFSTADNRTAFSAGEGFDLNLCWDLCGKTDHWYGSFSIGSDNETQSDIGSAVIDIHLAPREKNIFSISLDPGWNLISFPLYPQDTAIEKVLEPILGKYTAVWTFTENRFLSYFPFFPGLGSLDTLEPGKGYYIKMAEAADLDITGIRNPCAIKLGKGWNLTGFNLTSSREIRSVLSSVSGKYNSVWTYACNGFLTYSPQNEDASDFTSLEPGRGYWIKTNEACLWKFKP